MPTDPNDPLAKQNIKDRYYGVNDPVAEKIMKRAASKCLARFVGHLDMADLP